MLNYRRKSPLLLVWERFKIQKTGLLSLSFITIFSLFVLSAPIFEWLFDLNAEVINLFNRFQPPSVIHFLGTDELGRDLFIRLLHGGRVSLLVGISASVFAAIIGIIIGIMSGYFGGYLDAFLMRFTDSVMALPLLPLLIIFASIDLKKINFLSSISSNEDGNIYKIIIIISFVGWTTVARLVRAKTIVLRNADFVLSAKGLGASNFRIIYTHILPNLASPIIVATTLSIGNIILLESVLSFLGLGIQPPTPSWGNLLTNAQELIWEAPLLAFYPGLLIFFTVFSFNFLGDCLQDAVDPRGIEMQ